MGSVRAGGVPTVRRIRRITVAEVHCSGEEFCGSLAAILREIRGERERGSRDTYRCGRGEETAGNYSGLNAERIYCGGGNRRRRGYREEEEAEVA
jgi:hypothetical protein